MARVVAREEIGRSLQHEAIHTLFAIGLHLQKLPLETEEQRTRSGIEESIAELDDAITGLRQLIYGLRPGEG